MMAKKQVDISFCGDDKGRIIAVIVTTYRISMFGDYKKYKPTASNMIQWTKELQDAQYDFLPTIINEPLNEISIPLVGTNNNEKRVQFTSPDNSLVIRLLSNRIDVEATLFESKKPETDLKTKQEDMLSLISTVLNMVKGSQGTRMALFIDAMIPEEKQGRFKQIYADNNMGLSYNNAIECAEWRHLFNTHIKISLKENIEVCNSIISQESAILNRIDESTGGIKQISGLHVSADINTLGENTNERFDTDSLQMFIEEAQKEYLSILQQINVLFDV